MNVLVTPSWIQCQCPTIWALLREEARRCPPPGIQAYLTGGDEEECEAGRSHLEAADRALKRLAAHCGGEAVGDAYRRDLSGVATVSQVAELFCEITLCAALAEVSTSARLRPPTGKGTHSDIAVVVEGERIFGEVKRFEDTWPSGRDGEDGEACSRSLCAAPPGEVRPNTQRPRSMDLRSKLRSVPRQLPDGAPGVVFVFHPSYGSTHAYLRQALFGDAAFFLDQGPVEVDRDGLFADPAWGNVSACCRATVQEGGQAALEARWTNPRATTPLSERLLDHLQARLAASPFR